MRTIRQSSFFCHIQQLGEKHHKQKMYNSCQYNSNIYPIIDNGRAKEVGEKFINELVKLGFGMVKITEGNSGFKRHHAEGWQLSKRPCKGLETDKMMTGGRRS